MNGRYEKLLLTEKTVRLKILQTRKVLLNFLKINENKLSAFLLCLSSVSTILSCEKAWIILTLL